MVVSLLEPDRLPQAMSAAKEFGACFIALRTNCAQAQPKQRPRKPQAAEGMPRPGRDETDFEYG
jgi:hypothetical protein